MNKLSPPNSNFLSDNKKFLIFIFIFSLFLRIGYTVLLKHNYIFYGFPSSDVLYYQERAYDIASGDWLGKKTLTCYPLYPYFLAFLIRLTLNNFTLIRFVHLLMGSINCLLIFLLGKKIFSRKVGILASILASTNFLLIYYDWILMPVTLLISIILIILLSLPPCRHPEKRREWFLLGIFLGLGAIGDGKILIFSILVLAWLGFSHKTPFKKKFLTMLLPITLGFSLFPAAISIKNRVISGDWYLISAHSGINLYFGNNPHATGIFDNPLFVRPTHEGHDEDQRIIAETQLQRNLSPNEASIFWRNKALNFIQQHPKEYLQLIIKKAAVFLTDTELASDLDLIFQGEFRKKFNFNPFFLICPMALLGILIALRKKKTIAFPGLLIVSQFLITLLFFLTTRHRVTLLPILLIFQSYFAFWVIEQFQARKLKKILFTMLFIGLYLFLFRPQSIRTETKQFSYQSKLGAILIKKKQFARAEKALKKALEIRPHDSISWYNLGIIYIHLNNFDSAKTALTRSVQLCDFNLDAHFNLGYVEEKQKNYSSALDHYQKVLSLQPERLDIHYRVANIHKILGNCTEMLPHLNFITQKQPNLTQDMKAFISNCRKPEILPKI